jgi:hypothetical protein
MLHFVSVGEAVETEPRRRRSRAVRFGLILTGVVILLFGVPWATLIWSGNAWPAPVFWLGTAVFAVAAATFPVLMLTGHGRGLDWAARVADTMLGVVWVLFVWSILGQVLGVVLRAAPPAGPAWSPRWSC